MERSRAWLYTGRRFYTLDNDKSKQVVNFMSDCIEVKHFGRTSGQINTNWNWSRFSLWNCERLNVDEPLRSEGAKPFWSPLIQVAGLVVLWLPKKKTVTNRIAIQMCNCVHICVNTTRLKAASATSKQHRRSNQPNLGERKLQLP